jgi:hypothetical protein
MDTPIDTPDAAVQESDANVRRFSPQELDHAQELTQRVVEYCVTKLGRCTFASEDALCLNVQSVGIELDDVVISVWSHSQCFVKPDEPLPLPTDPPLESDHAGAAQWSWRSSVVASLLEAAIVAPVKWTAQQAWSVASWMAYDVAGHQRGSPMRVEALPTLTAGARSSPRKGIIFLPALHGLSRSVLDDLAAHHPYHNIFTVEMWEDYLLEGLDIRSGDEVTEFLVAHRNMATISDDTTKRTGIVPNALVNTEATRQLFHWIALMETVDRTLVRWEHRMNDLKDSIRHSGEESIPQDMEAVSDLQSAIDEYKLVQIQMVKLHASLLGSEESTSLNECLAAWDNMMENFPHVLSLLELSETL